MSPPVSPTPITTEEVKEDIVTEVNPSIWGSSSSTAMEKFTTLPPFPHTVINLTKFHIDKYLQNLEEFCRILKNLVES